MRPLLARVLAIAHTLPESLALRVMPPSEHDSRPYLLSDVAILPLASLVVSTLPLQAQLSPPLLPAATRLCRSNCKLQARTIVTLPRTASPAHIVLRITRHEIHQVA